MVTLFALDVGQLVRTEHNSAYLQRRRCPMTRGLSNIVNSIQIDGSCARQWPRVKSTLTMVATSTGLPLTRYGW